MIYVWIEYIIRDAYLGLYESVVLQRRVRGSPPVNCGGVAVVGCDGS
jgi:hypothetical protein